MERERVANAILWPVDTAIGLSVNGLAKAGVLSKLSGAAYFGLKTLLFTQFKAVNGLEIEGLDPPEADSHPS